MTRRSSEVAAGAKRGWDAGAWQVYEAAVAVFGHELDERARFGAQLAAARKARSLTQPSLAALAGVQQAEISRIERGIGNPTEETLIKLTSALGLRLTLELVPGR